MANFFTDLFSTSAAKDAAAARKAGQDAGYAGASDLLGQGRTAISSGYADALAKYQPLTDSATRSFNLYGDITGAGGVAGQQRAQDLFMTDPGYEFQRDEALRGIDRTAAGEGRFGSGNAAIALQNRASELAKGSYDTWAQRALAAAGMAPGIVSSSAGLDVGLGKDIASSLGQQGQLKYGVETAKAEADAKAEEDRLRASGQFWNTLIGGAGLALKASGLGGFGVPQAVGVGGGGGWTGWNPNVPGGWQA